VRIRSVPIGATGPSDGVAAVGGPGFQRRLSGVPGHRATVGRQWHTSQWCAGRTAMPMA